MKQLSSAAITLLAIAGLIAGCGSGGGSGVSDPALPTSGPISKAQATAYAHAVNLGVADVPGMTSSSLEGENKEGSSLTETECGLRESHLKVADIASPTFRSGEGGPLQVAKSDVEVVPTVALADQKLTHIDADLRSPRARACLERAYAQSFTKGLTKGSAGHVFTLGRTTVSVLHLALPRSFGLQVVIPLTLTVNGIPAHTGLYMDGYGFIVGRAGISLVTLGFSHPVPAATGQRLLALLHSRAKS